MVAGSGLIFASEDLGLTNEKYYKLLNTSQTQNFDKYTETEVKNIEFEDCGTIIGREFRGHDITYYVLFRGDRYIVHTDNRDLFELDDRVIMKPLEKAVVLEQNKAIQ